MMNQTRRTLDDDEPAVGAWVLSGSPRAAETLARTAVDWLGIDTEHAPYAPESVEATVRAIEGHATPLVRLSSVESATTGDVKHALDAGARGVIVPGIETRDDAERVVRAARFPPAGNRGVAGTVRANEYGTRFDEYVATANDETLVVAQLESPTAIERVGDILAVDGIDVAFVGENDLSAAIGHPGDTDHPEVRAAVQQVRTTAESKGVVPGIAARTPDDLRERTEQGFRFFLLGADVSFMRRGIAAFLPD